MPKTLYELVNEGAPHPELIELKSGFFALPGTDTRDLFTQKLILLLHSFHPGAYVNNANNPDYTDRRDTLVRSYELPILMGFEDMRLPISIAWLKGLKPQGPRIIYLTGYADSIPTKPTEAEFIRRINETFHPSSIRLGGAELYLKDNGDVSESGCVNHAFRFLSRHLPVELDKRYCWKGSGIL